MGKVEEIVQNCDILTNDGFRAACKAVRSVNEGELRFILIHNSQSLTKPFQQAQILAKCELERRSMVETKKVAWISAGAGLFGVIVGAVMQCLLTA